MQVIAAFVKSILQSESISVTNAIILTINYLANQKVELQCQTDQTRKPHYINKHGISILKIILRQT